MTHSKPTDARKQVKKKTKKKHYAGVFHSPKYWWPCRYE